MRTMLRSNHIFYFALLFMLIIILIFSKFFSTKVYAESSSPFFGLQDLKIEPHNWIDVWRERHTNNGANYIDLRDINYYSDGKFLNATLWLDSFNPKPPPERNVNYGIYIDADMNNKTGIAGIDYKVEIQWHGETKTWTKVLEQWSSSGQNRTLDIQYNYSGFYNKKGEGAYVVLDANLKQMLWPNRYKVLFYAEEIKNNELIWIMDSSKWIYVPPPEFVISTSPRSVDIRAGEQKTIEVEVKSTRGFEPNVHLYSPTESSNYLRFEFQYDNLRIPSFGMTATPLIIYTSKEALAYPYTILVSADFNFPSGITPWNGIRLPSQTLSNQSSLVVNIGYPLNAMDIISDFWNKLGGFINFVYLIGGAAASWIFSRYIKKKK